MRRKRRAGVEDLWTQSVRLADDTTRTVPTARAGRGMRWRARYVDAEGRERTKAFRRKIDAAQWLDGITAQFATGTYVKPEAGQVTVAAVYASRSASQGHISPKTAATRRSAWTSRVEPPWGGVAVIDVKTAAVRAWVSSMVADEVGAPTIENAFGLLRQVLGAAVEDSRLPRNPCDGVKLPKRRHADRGYLSHAQVAALASRVDRQAEVVRFLAYTGLRWGEMAALRVQDFDMLRRRVNVSRSVTESSGPGVEHAEEPRTTLSAVPCIAGRRARSADGWQGPRRPGVHQPTWWGVAKLQLAGSGVLPRRAEVPDR